MLYGKVKQADWALCDRATTTMARARGSFFEREAPPSRTRRQEWVALDDEIDEANDYPSKPGLLGMFAAALFGAFVLAALYLFFYDPSGY